MACVVTVAKIPKDADAFSLVVKRQRELLVAHVSTPVNMRVEEPIVWANSLRENGQWADIDYENRAGGAWLTLQHLHRVKIMARALASSGAQEPELEATTLRALSHWTNKRYQNPNWWQNDIGVPQVMRDIIVLLGDRLDGALHEGAFAVLRQYKQQPPGYGANTVWTAELALMDGALCSDAEKIINSSRIIAGEIVVGAEQGIQRDFSFHQHGARLQQFHYGQSFFADTTRLAWLLRGTPWAFSKDKTGILGDYALEGCAWMCRGIATVPGTLDRATSRPGTLGSAADLRRELSMLRDLLPERAQAFEQMRAAQDQRTAAIKGFRTFPYSDFSTYHKNEYSFFLKTISPRTEVTETLSRENQKGKFLNWGDHYILRDGTEYAALPPVWDWDLLPGVTAHAGIKKIERRAFSGSTDDGASGVAAMDYRVSGDGADSKAALSARKFWAAHDGVIVALIGGLHAGGSKGIPVRTALDQCRLRDAVVVGYASGARVVTESFPARKGIRWLHHAGMLYVPFGEAEVSAKIGPATGSWKRINLNYSDDPVTEPVFLPVLEHGATPSNQACGFAIMACASPDDASALAGNPAWRVLQNDSICQAVRFNDDTIMAVFYERGKLNVEDAPKIETKQSCIILIKGGRLFASDPLHEGRTLNIAVDARPYTLLCPPDGGTSEAVPLRIH